MWRGAGVCGASHVNPFLWCFIVDGWLESFHEFNRKDLFVSELRQQRHDTCDWS